MPKSKERANERAKLRRRERRAKDPKFREAEARWAKAYRDRKRGAPAPIRVRKSVNQHFTPEEVEAAARVIEIVARGGDASVIIKGEAHRSYSRKIFELRKKAKRLKAQ